jgi:hypothetical protein
MVTPVAPSTSNINDRFQCRRHLKAEERGATAGTRIRGATRNGPMQSIRLQKPEVQRGLHSSGRP